MCAHPEHILKNFGLFSQKCVHPQNPGFWPFWGTPQKPLFLAFFGFLGFFGFFGFFEVFIVFIVFIYLYIFIFLSMVYENIFI